MKTPPIIDDTTLVLKTIERCLIPSLWTLEANPDLLSSEDKEAIGSCLIYLAEAHDKIKHLEENAPQETTDN